MSPSLQDIAETVWVTWPGEETVETPAFTLRRSGDDSRRSRAASAKRDVTDKEISDAAQQMAAWGQPALFFVPSDAPDFDAQLEVRGYRSHDSAVYYVGRTAEMAARRPPRLSTFEIWEPLAIMADLWAENGISAERQEVMLRALRTRVGLWPRGQPTRGSSLCWHQWSAGDAARLGR